MVANIYKPICKFFVSQQDTFEHFEQKAMDLNMSKEYSKDVGKRQSKRKKTI